jgi:hypothetical protein
VSTTLLVIACVVALVNVPTSAGMLVWGLAGGDGRVDRWYEGVLALVILVGSLYSVGACFGAFGGISLTRWLLMWVPVAAAALALLLVVIKEKAAPSDVLTTLWMPLMLAVPPLLVWLSGEVLGGR